MADKKTVFPYIPNSAPEIQDAMLKEIGVKSIDEFYECIPEKLRLKRKMNLPDPLLSEQALKRHFEKIFSRNACCSEKLSFLGGGCWNHYVPAICDEVNHRSEFLTAYAGEPYEDHGRFQALFEYCSMMGELLDMDVVNVPTYDGAQAAATSARMASRVTGRTEILVSDNVNPDNLAAIRNYCIPDIKLTRIPMDPTTGLTILSTVKSMISNTTAALYIENPNYMGLIETGGQELANLLHDNGALLIVGADPSSLGVLTPPSGYGADIVCGDIQPLGLHMYSGGARAGYIATRDEERFVMEYPSRLFGIAPTSHKEWGFGDVAWERTSFAQRENAKEFVGTAAALWGITAGVYLALMGPQGMFELGQGILQRSQYLMKELSQISGVSLPYKDQSHFKEFVVNFDATGKSVKAINKALMEKDIFGGHDLSAIFPDRGQSALYAVTEVHTMKDMDTLVSALKEIVEG